MVNAMFSYKGIWQRVVFLLLVYLAAGSVFVVGVSGSVTHVSYMRSFALQATLPVEYQAAPPIEYDMNDVATLHKLLNLQRLGSQGDGITIFIADSNFVPSLQPSIFYSSSFISSFIGYLYFSPGSISSPTFITNIYHIPEQAINEETRDGSYFYGLVHANVIAYIIHSLAPKAKIILSNVAATDIIGLSKVYDRWNYVASWTIQHKSTYNIRVFTCSFGTEVDVGGMSNVYPDRDWRELEIMIRNIYLDLSNAGIFVTVAAGNGASNHQHIIVEAAISGEDLGTVSIGSVYYANGQFYRSSFSRIDYWDMWDSSSDEQDLTLMAMGEQIKLPILRRAVGETEWSTCYSTRYVGTSWSTPIVAASVLLLIKAIKSSKGYYVSPATIENYFKPWYLTSPPEPNPNRDYYGYGILNGDLLLQAAGIGGGPII